MEQEDGAPPALAFYRYPERPADRQRGHHAAVTTLHHDFVGCCNTIHVGRSVQAAYAHPLPSMLEAVADARVEAGRDSCFSRPPALSHASFFPSKRKRAAAAAAVGAAAQP